MSVRAREKQRGRHEPPCARRREPQRDEQEPPTTKRMSTRTSACGVRSRSPKRGTTSTSRSDGHSSHAGTRRWRHPAIAATAPSDEEPVLEVEGDGVDAAHRVERSGVEDRDERRIRRPRQAREDRSSSPPKKKIAFAFGTQNAHASYAWRLWRRAERKQRLEQEPDRARCRPPWSAGRASARRAPSAEALGTALGRAARRRRMPPRCRRRASRRSPSRRTGRRRRGVASRGSRTPPRRRGSRRPRAGATSAPRAEARAAPRGARGRGRRSRR